MANVVVQKGETLWDIAKRELGDPRRYKEIAAANKIQNPKKLKIGASLIIPGKSDTSDPTPRMRPQPVQLDATATAGGGAPGANAVGQIMSVSAPGEPGSPEFSKNLHDKVMSSFGPRPADPFSNADPHDPLGLMKLLKPDLANTGPARTVPGDNVHFDNADPYSGPAFDAGPMSGKPMGAISLPPDKQSMAPMPQGVQVADASGAVPQSAMPDPYAGIAAPDAEDPYAGIATPDAAADPYASSPMVARPPAPQPDYVVPSMSTDKAIARGVQLGIQGMGSGLADIIGSPIDLPSMLFNATTGSLDWLHNLVASPDNQFHTPPPASLLPGVLKQAAPPLFGPDTAANWIKDRASEVAGAAGVPPIPPEQQTNAEQQRLRDIEFATGAGLGGKFLAGKSAGLKARIPSGGKPKWGDPLVRPYVDRPMAAIARDAGSGVGASEAQGAVERNFGDQPPLANMLVALGGAILGGGITGGLQKIARAVPLPLRAGSFLEKYMKDANVPINPNTGIPFTKAETKVGAQAMQTAAMDPAKALASVTQNADDLRAAGIPDSGMMTSGRLSQDPGLNVFEDKFRMKNTPPFIARDQTVKDTAANKVGALRDPNADLGAVKTGVLNQEQAFKDARDAEALPLLRKAEASGVVVDPQPVADLIDQTLAQVKRPEVRKPLETVRKLLNVTGSDQLDTSISGLYETRKALNDIIQGKVSGDTPTGLYAKKELLAVRDSLDQALSAADPTFGQYLQKYREGSTPLDAFSQDTAVGQLKAADDPRRAAEKALSDPWQGATKLRDVSEVISADPAAQAAWKAAVGDVLKRRITGTKAAGDAGYEVSYAGLTKQFKDNEQALSQVYTPEEMNSLRQVHKMLGLFKNAEKQATPGSATAERMLMMGNDVMSSPIGKAYEKAVRLYYGALEGGAKVKKFKILAGAMPANRNNIGDLIHEAWFNPEIAKYLLGKKVTNLNAIPANDGLRAAIAADIAAQNNENRKEPLKLSIGAPLPGYQ